VEAWGDRERLEHSSFRPPSAADRPASTPASHDRTAESLAPHLYDEWIRVSSSPAIYCKVGSGRSGDRIDYTADFDGFTCRWTQALDLESKHPVGDPEAFFHSHDPRLSIFNAALSHQEISVARDKILFNMAEVSGKIWMMRCIPGE